MKIDLTRIQLAAEAATRAHTTPDSIDVQLMANKPKLPTFDEKLDELGAYLERFGRFTVGKHWNTDDWAVSLSPLLTGKVLQGYTKFVLGECPQLYILKVALWQRHEHREEGYRWRFRETKSDEGETAFQFVTRLRRCFTQWTLMVNSSFVCVLRRSPFPYVRGCLRTQRQRQ